MAIWEEASSPDSDSDLHIMLHKPIQMHYAVSEFVLQQEAHIQFRVAFMKKEVLFAGPSHELRSPHATTWHLLFSDPINLQ